MESNTFRPGTAGPGSCTSKVDLSIQCRDLMDKDLLSKSDPMVVLFVKHLTSSEWREFARTETIWNNLNPDFVRKFEMDYFFEERQELKFQVFDIDKETADLAAHDFLGELQCSLGEIVSNGKLTKRLTGPNVTKGSISICAEEQSSSKEEVTLHFGAKNLDKKDFFGKSDPYLKFYKVDENNEHILVHKTEFIKKTLNPTWKPFTIPLRVLCSADYDRLIIARCYDYNMNGHEDFIGDFTFTFRELINGRDQQICWEVINREKQTKKGMKYKNSGTAFLLKKPIVRTVPTFMDYVQSGTELSCVVAIDFTASNGNPSTPQSLHYINSQHPNEYERALRAVGEIIQDYDSDQLFPVFGFGARLPPHGELSHNFPIRLNHTDPNCEGIAGVLSAYQFCLRNVQLYGPTNFAPIINNVAQRAAQKRDGSEYYILLMITDGIITDMPQTTEAIVSAASLPLSIIIVGVGAAEFDAMDVLDGDGDQRLTDRRGRKAVRDIVQFVPFRDFVSGRAHNVSQARLAKEVLYEIPEQFLSYMAMNNIQPGRPRHSQAARPSVSGSTSASASQQRPLQTNTSANQAPAVPHAMYPEPPPAYSELI